MQVYIIVSLSKHSGWGASCNVCSTPLDPLLFCHLLLGRESESEENVTNGGAVPLRSVFTTD
jgi:hypothetical protein